MNAIINMNGPDEIITNLYIGDYSVASDIYYLTTQNFNVIICCLPTPPGHLLHSGIDYYHIPILDTKNENLSRHLPSAIRYIHQNLVQGKKILVHCWAGKSRSPAIVIAYLMFRYSISYEDALMLVKRKRGIVKLNSGFIKQLQSIFL